MAIRDRKFTEMVIIFKTTTTKKPSEFKQETFYSLQGMTRV